MVKTTSAKTPSVASSPSKAEAKKPAAKAAAVKITPIARKVMSKPTAKSPSVDLAKLDLGLKFASDGKSYPDGTGLIRCALIGGARPAVVFRVEKARFNDEWGDYMERIWRQAVDEDPTPDWVKKLNFDLVKESWHRRGIEQMNSKNHGIRLFCIRLKEAIPDEKVKALANVIREIVNGLITHKNCRLVVDEDCFYWFEHDVTWMDVTSFENAKSRLLEKFIDVIQPGWAKKYARVISSFFPLRSLSEDDAENLCLPDEYVKLDGQGDEGVVEMLFDDDENDKE